MRDVTNLSLKGQLRIIVRRRGLVVADIREPNLVLSAAADVIVRALGGTAPIYYIGVGNGTTPVSPGQTGLSGTGYNAPITGVAYPAVGEVVYTAEVGAGDANELGGITEFVLFSADLGAYSRRVRTPAIPKTHEITLTIEWAHSVVAVDNGA